MTRKSKKAILVSIVLVSCLFVASCSTSNPPVDAKTGATTITPKS